VPEKVLYRQQSHGLFLGLLDYKSAWRLQTHLVSAKISGKLKHPVFLFMEHPPVFTLGRRGGRENLKVPEAFLGTKGIDVVHIERGGDITYHGPGQLIIYPIVDLRKARLGVKEFVFGLEEVMIRVAADSGVRAERNDINRGVWVGSKKLGSIGIAIRHGVSFHGLALNVNTDLEPFSWVNPCGLSGVQMISLEEATGGKGLSMEQALRSARIHIEAVFQTKIQETSFETLNQMIESAPELEEV